MKQISCLLLSRFKPKCNRHCGGWQVRCFDNIFHWWVSGTLQVVAAQLNPPDTAEDCHTLNILSTGCQVGQRRLFARGRPAILCAAVPSPVARCPSNGHLSEEPTAPRASPIVISDLWPVLTQAVIRGCFVARKHERGVLWKL